MLHRVLSVMLLLGQGRSSRLTHNADFPVPGQGSVSQLSRGSFAVLFVSGLDRRFLADVASAVCIAVRASLILYYRFISVPFPACGQSSRLYACDLSH